MEILVVALLLIILALATLTACVYRTLVTSRHRTASEAQIRKSCQEQARLHRAELEALQAKATSQARAIGSLERERRLHETRMDDLTMKCGMRQQDQAAVGLGLQHPNQSWSRRRHSSRSASLR
jgi:Tfp pilus assembly protein PilE